MMLLWTLACTDPTPPASEPTATDTDVGTPTDTGEPATTADTAPPTPPPPPYRPTAQVCDEELPPLPTQFSGLPAFGPNEDFGFDAHGYLVGVGGNSNLTGRNRDGDVQLIAPAIGEAKGTRHLPDGSVAIALSGEGAVAVVHPDGQREIRASIPAPNGITTDIAGNIWVASSTGALYRIAPDGQADIVANIGFSLDGIAFSPDFYRIYVNSEFGDIHYVELDDDFEAVSEPQLLVRVPLVFSILDGMTTDMCGNVYVTRMDARVFRYKPDGTPAGSMNFQTFSPIPAVTPALNFGSGVGGFERDHLYVMNFLGGVMEADIGIDGHWEPHYPLPE